MQVQNEEGGLTFTEVRRFGRAFDLEGLAAAPGPGVSPAGTLRCCWPVREAVRTQGRLIKSSRSTRAGPRRSARARRRSHRRAGPVRDRCRRVPSDARAALTAPCGSFRTLHRPSSSPLILRFCVAVPETGIEVPALLAPACDGRFILGIGAGWYEREYQAYGYEFPRAGVRLEILEETCEVIKRLWTEETVTYQGKHLTFDGAYCDPKPLQQLPEFWIGGGGEKVTLRIEARHADKTNWQTGLEGFVRKSNLLRSYCDEIGRDFDSVVRTHGPDCRVFDTEADTRRWLDSPEGGSLWGGGDREEYLRDNLVGTAEQVAEKAQAFVDAGCREFVLW